MVDDKDVGPSEGLLLGRAAAGDLNAPTGGGLYLAGIPALVRFGVQKARMAKTTAGFRGNIRDVVFINDE